MNQRDIEEDARRSPALPLRPFSCTFGTALTSIATTVRFTRLSRTSSRRHGQSLQAQQAASHRIAALIHHTAEPLLFGTDLVIPHALKPRRHLSSTAPLPRDGLPTIPLIPLLRVRDGGYTTFHHSRSHRRPGRITSRLASRSIRRLPAPPGAAFSSSTTSSPQERTGTQHEHFLSVPASTSPDCSSPQPHASGSRRRAFHR